MTKEIVIWGILVLGYTAQALSGVNEDSPLEYMSKEDRETLKEEARDMFYHAYNAYMDNAYPADELMPLSCKGRYRGSEADRGDIDSTLGNFSLTLVDTLDTLVVLGDLGEFENAVRLVVKDVTFDTDVIVSLFETNIRMLGGLLSGHILSEYLQSRADIMPWYRGELLTLAKDLGYRFLPAFNTTTGIPFGRINLRHGMKGVPAEMCRETCTACAGSMILEMAALSRLTGESIFEDKAQKAMDALWKMRHRGTDLMGSVLNVHSGDWVRRDSGVGAGIDSYYEYCLKAYILLGDEKYLGRFNKHYHAVMKYVSQGPMLLDVHMHRPNTNSKNFMDALLAFWPGLQVLKGDIKPAVETHEMLYQVMQRHNFIPEAFTTDFQVHWGHHPLRPEFLESTYFLYRATGDHYYLGVGRKVLKSLQTYARVPCGYAAVSDVRTNKHDDTMDSFVLSETFKYLYLLFAEPSDLILDLDEFIFTTEGHLLPLTLAAVQTNVTSDLDRDIVQVDELGRTCPNSLHLFPASVRQPLRNMVEDVCPRRSLKRRLNASQFQANNLEHLKILSNMGITVLTPTAGSVQVLHMFSNARTAQDAEEGLLFMQEMVELSKKQSQQSETRVQSVTYLKTDTNPPHKVTLLAGPAHFGPELKDGKKVTGTTEFAIPSSACTDLLEPEKLAGKIVLVSRGNCMFVEKARRIQSAGAIAVVVLDTVVGSSVTVSPMFAMSGDGKEPDDVTIPVVFLFHKEASNLLVAHFASGGSMSITIGEYTPRDEVQLNAPGDLSVFERLKGSVKDFLIRQITPQNAGSTNEAAVIRAETQMLNRAEGPPPIEYVINNCHLTAMLYKQLNIMKIIKKDGIPPSWRSSKTLSSNLEKPWYTFIQEIVNDLYSSHKDYIIIPVAKIQFHYKWIQELRRQEMIALSKLSEELSMETMAFWFLEEICNMAPYLPSTDEPTLSNVNKDNKPDEHRTSKHNHEQLLMKVDTSQDTLQVTNAVTKNTEKQTKNDPEDCAIVDTPEDSVDTTEELKEVLALRSEMIELIRSKLIDARKATKPSSSTSEDVELKSILDSVKQRNAAYVNNLYFNIGHLKSFFCPETGILKIKVIEAPNLQMSEPQMLEDFEHTWRKLRRNILNAMYTDEDFSVEIAVKPHVESQYRTVQTLRGILHEDDDPSLETMVIWFVKQLSEIRPEISPDVWARTRPRFNQESMMERNSNPEKYAKRIADLFGGQEPKPSPYDSMMDFNKISDDMENALNEIGKAPVESLEMIERAHSARNNKIVHDSKNHSTKVDESSDTDEVRKPADQSDNNDIEKSEGISVEGNAPNFLVQEDVVADDPLEEFKKPIWAPEDGKDAAKSFPRFQGKPDLSNIRYDSARERNYDYQSEYTTKTKNDETKTRRSNKHTKDDL